MATIQRSNLDGTAVEMFASANNGAADVAVSSGKVYWTDSIAEQVVGGGQSGQVWRANADGSDPQSIVSGLVHPIAVAVNGSKVYWTEVGQNFDGQGSIQRSNLDGSDLETLLSGIDEANGLAIDPAGGRMYWTDLASQRIQSANLDGSDVADVLTGLDAPTQIDIFGGKMYWTNSGGQSANSILRANLDGSQLETLVSGDGFPFGIAVVPEPCGILLAMFGICGLLVFRNRYLKKPD
jgi:low density lipoprotein receptor-related protein 5/6